MKHTILILVAFLASSCLKKIEGVNDLDTNIFDKEYTGPCWFYVDDTYTYFNTFGMQRVMVEAVLPEENVPGLKPSLIFITCQVNNQQEILFNSTVNNKGDYTFYFDAMPESSNSYCLEAGIYLQSQDTTINRFTICTQP